MGQIAYLFSDYIKDVSAANITLTNEDPNYPTENSQTEEIAETCRTTDKVNILYQVNLGAVVGAKALQIFFLGNHNFNGGSVKIYSYTDAGFSLNQVLVATITYRQFDAFIRVGSPPAARQYWEFDFTKNGTVTSAYSFLEFGRPMMFGDLVQLTEIEDWEKLRGYGFLNIVNETRYGIRYAHKLNEQRERFALKWGERMATNIPGELRTLFSNIHGRAHPFVFIPDISGTACYYVFSEEDELKWTEIFGTGASAHAGNFNLNLIEAVRGKIQEG